MERNENVKITFSMISNKLLSIKFVKLHEYFELTNRKNNNGSALSEAVFQ